MSIDQATEKRNGHDGEMRDFFIELFEYGHYFNQRLGDVFIENAGKIATLEKSVALYSHILNAHRVWINRIEPMEKTFGIWDLQPVGSFKAIDETNHKHSFLILDKFDLDEIISYTTTKGQPLKNSVRDILFQVINHSTYHRGQIASEFRKVGLEPLLTDYIVYTWKL